MRNPSLCVSPASGRVRRNVTPGRPRAGRASAAATAPGRAVYSNNHYSVVGRGPPGEGLLCVKRFGHALAEAGRGRVRAARSRCGRSPVLGANAAAEASWPPFVPALAMRMSHPGRMASDRRWFSRWQGIAHKETAPAHLRCSFRQREAAKMSSTT